MSEPQVIEPPYTEPYYGGVRGRELILLPPTRFSHKIFYYKTNNGLQQNY
jgi:hypothetical protein